MVRSFPSLQTNLAGRGQKLPNPLRIQPGPTTRHAQKLDQAPQPPAPNHAGQNSTVFYQDVQQMRDLHEEVIAPHGLPVVRKAVLVPITVMLLHQNAFFDSPTMPRPQVTTLIHVIPVPANPRNPPLPTLLLPPLHR